MPPLPDDELLPWWWQRQADPTSPDVVPGAGSAVSCTHRNWAVLGTVGAPERAVVDPRGAVTPWPDGWSLDWWVGADDTWHLPSRSVGVRQRLVGAAPVVETVLRVPGGELVHRAWAVAAGDGVAEGGAVAVELENASPVPVAVALAVRPFGPLGRATVSSISLDGTTVSVDGRPALVLPKPPSRFAVGSAARDAVVPTLSGEALPEWPEGGARCAQGRASAAFLFPLPHTATVRVLVPLAAPRPASSRRRAPEPPSTADPRSVADPHRVASGWEVQTRRAPRLELPEPRLVEALAASRRFALLHAAGDDVASWPPVVVGGLDTAELCVALDQHGLHAEAERLLLGFADRQGLDGSFAGEATRVDAASAWLHAVGHHVRLTGDPALAEALVGPIAKAAHHLRRRLVSRRGRRADVPVGLFPPGPTAPWVPVGDAPSLHDALWARRGLLDAALALEAAAQPDAAAEPRAVAAEIEAALGAVLAEIGPGTVGTADAVATAVALAATLEGPEPVPPALTAALPACLDASPEPVRGGVWQEPGTAGLSPRLTAWVGTGRAACGRTDAAEQLRWLLEHGAPLWAWPELVHPRTGGGCAGEGHHAASTAAVLGLLRGMVVRERDGGLDLLPAVPDDWLGRSIEAHDVPTSFGRLSFAVRWHGERPALLWELEPHEDPSVTAAVVAASPAGFRLRASGLDPSWGTTEPRGEALLAAPGRLPGAPAAEPDPPAATADEVSPQRASEPLDPEPPSGGESFT